MTNVEPEVPYTVSLQHERYKVVTDEKVVLVCGDAASATQYAALLNEAYQRGYKAGFRKARSG